MTHTTKETTAKAKSITTTNSDPEVKVSGVVKRHVRKADGAGNIAHYVQIRQEASVEGESAVIFRLTARGKESDEILEGVEEGNLVEATAAVAVADDWKAAFRLTSITVVEDLDEYLNSVPLLGKVKGRGEDPVVKQIVFQAGGSHGLMRIAVGEDTYVVRFHGEDDIANAETFNVDDEVEIQAHIGYRRDFIQSGPLMGKPKWNAEIIVDSIKRVSADETPATSAKATEEVAAA